MENKTTIKPDNLIHIAMSKQKEIIRHEFTEDEKNAMMITLTRNLIKLNSLKEELQSIKDDYNKVRMAPMDKENNVILRNVYHGFRDDEIEVFLVPDYDNKIVEFYNLEGHKVGERRMMLSELQGRLSL